VEETALRLQGEHKTERTRFSFSLIQAFCAAKLPIKAAEILIRNQLFSQTAFVLSSLLRSKQLSKDIFSQLRDHVASTDLLIESFGQL